MCLIALNKLPPKCNSKIDVPIYLKINEKESTSVNVMKISPTNYQLVYSLVCKATLNNRRKTANNEIRNNTIIITTSKSQSNMNLIFFLIEIFQRIKLDEKTA